MVDQFLRVVSDPNQRVYAMGDCACCCREPLPCTAQVAERQGRYLATSLSASSKEEVKPFVFQSSGMLAYIGGYQALHDLPAAKSQGL